MTANNTVCLVQRSICMLKTWSELTAFSAHFTAIWCKKPTNIHVDALLHFLYVQLLQNVQTQAESELISLNRFAFDLK